MTLARTGGTVGFVTVAWAVTAGAAAVTPTSGVVTFAPEQATATIELRAVADGLPEPAEPVTTPTCRGTGMVRARVGHAWLA